MRSKNEFHGRNKLIILSIFSRKDALDVLKIMMSILGFEQDEKDKFFERLKSIGKKSMFAKLL